jgi:hypothetical protein
MGWARHQAPAYQAPASPDERLRKAVAGTILAELWRTSFRRTYHIRPVQMARDPQAYQRLYDLERPRQSYRPRGRTPAPVFSASQEH